MTPGSVTRLPRQEADRLHGAPRRRAGSAGSPPVQPPRRATELELLGRFEDSGLKKPPYLVRRADGQVLQLSHLLYVLVEAADGKHDLRAMARAATEQTGRSVSAENVQLLVDRKLRPMGVLTAADGSEPQLEKHGPLIALRNRRQIIPASGARVLAAIFAPMFWPPVIVAVLAAIAALDAWLFFSHGLGGGMRAALYNPLLLFLTFGSIIVATAFHEVGHAAACRYGGARPGGMGAAIYLIWPAFFCDVTDSYRLSRGGRLRTDLGGVYFNGVFALLAAGAYFATGQEALLIVVSIQHLIVIQQLLPLLRFDGYYVLSDLTGLPDVVSRIGPVYRSLNPFRPTEAKAAELKPWARAAVVAYLALLVPLATVAVVWVIKGAPRLFATFADSLVLHAERAVAELSAGDWTAMAAEGIQVPALLLPCLGTAFTCSRLGMALAGAMQRWSAESRARKGVAIAGATGLAFFIIVSWLPSGQYVPIQPEERGTVQESLSPVPWETAAVEQPISAGDAIAGARERAGAVRPAVTAPPRTTAQTGDAAEPYTVGGREPADREPPRFESGRSSATAAPPPAGQESQATTTPPAPAPTPPAPEPPPPGEEPEPTVEIPTGDPNNYAIAINTEDAKQVFELAFALQMVRDGRVEHKNIARAYASCEGCRTIAIAIQIVLIAAKDLKYVVPWNIAQAHNEGCTACETLAAAHQLVFTTAGEVRLKESASKEVDRIEDELAALEDSDASIPEIERQVDEMVAELHEVVLGGLVLVDEGGNEVPAEPAPPESEDEGDVEEDVEQETDDGSEDGAGTTPERDPTPTAETVPTPATVPETTEVTESDEEVSGPEPTTPPTETTPTTTTTTAPSETTTTTTPTTTSTTPSETATTSEEPATTTETTPSEPTTTETTPSETTTTTTTP